MKNLSRISFILLCFISQPSLAITTQKMLGVYISDIAYEEPNFMSENGSMFGILGSYGIYGDYMIKFEGSYSEGLVDYTGSGSDEAYDHIIELRELGGKNIKREDGSIVTPFVGLGYRYLNDDMAYSISTTGYSGYEREQSYFYSPLGFEYSNKQLKNGWTMGGSMEYDVFWQGINHTNLSTIPGYYDITLNQYKGHGYRFSLRFTKESPDKHTYMIEPFFKHWNIDDSDITIDLDGDMFVEPQNTSDEIGVNFLWILK